MRRAEFGDRLGQGVGGGGGGGKVGDGEMVGQGRVERERGGIAKRHGEGGQGAGVGNALARLTDGFAGRSVQTWHYQRLQARDKGQLQSRDSWAIRLYLADN